MKWLRTFIQQNVDPATRLGEVLFGLIMALGFTGAVRLGLDEADNWSLFKSILGCNIAWGIVDGVMYVLTTLFERNRKARIVHKVQTASSEREAIEKIGEELDDRFAPSITAEERREVYGWVLKLVKRGGLDTSGLKLSDILSGLAVSILIVLSTFPVVVPFLLIRDPYWAVRFSNLVGVTLLFWLGLWWGQITGLSSIRLSASLALIGIVLVLITIALGG